MSRNLSVVQELNQVVTAEGLLVLLDITNLGASPDLFYVNNKEAVTSNAQVYTPYGFNLILATEDGETLPTFQLAVDAVDRELIDEIRTLSSPPTVKIQIVPISDPDVIEIAIPDLEMRDIKYDAFTISGTLYWGEPLNQRFPAQRYTPENCPGLF
jgi:hypothetical protein